MITRQTSLSNNIIRFCRFLRTKNFNLGADEESTALHALTFIEFNNKHIFQAALKAVLCRSQVQLSAFDALFDLYWKETAKAVDAKEKMKKRPGTMPAQHENSFNALKSWLNGNRNDEMEHLARYSFHESLSRKDFSLVPAHEVPELMRTIRALSRQLAAVVNRRYQRSNKVAVPDLRKTLRINMRRGGELLDIAFREPKRNRIRVVVLCDVSKSMDLYAAFLLQFMYAFQQVYRRMETFTFGTSLQRITAILHQHDFSTSLQLLNTHNESWSGGTRIGECLHDFVTRSASRLLTKQTIVIILSDGWDTGDASLLRNSMEAIWRRSKKTIWLNPLAGYPLYRPDASGMQAALPFIDVFAPVHNVDSLRQLKRWL